MLTTTAKFSKGKIINCGKLIWESTKNLKKSNKIQCRKESKRWQEENN